LVSATDPTAIARPSLHVPFDSAVSPYAEEVDQRTVDWAVGAGLVPQSRAAMLRRSRLGLLAGRTHPRADIDTLTDVAAWYAWLAIFDGYCDEPATVREPDRFGAHLVRLLRVLESDTDANPREVFDATLADLRERARSRATADQLRRLALSVHGYFMGLLWEGGHRRVDAPVSFDDYRYMRRHTGGVPSWLMLMEIFGGNRPDPSDLAHPDMLGLCTRIGHVLTWQNDIISYDVEMASGVRIMSLPTVLEQERGWPAQRALDAAADLLTAELDGYAAAERQVLSWAGPALAGYVGDLRDLVAGCLTWHLETGRYV
jgi:hypothetical protein